MWVSETAKIVAFITILNEKIVHYSSLVVHYKKWILLRKDRIFFKMAQNRSLYRGFHYIQVRYIEV